MTTPIILWHGAHRWMGPPQIVPPRKGHAEHGAGIYCTTHYERARQYSAGGGKTMQLHLKPNITLLEDVWVNGQDIYDATQKIPRLKKKDLILNDIERSMKRSRDGQIIGLATLVNLAVNHEAMQGDPAVAITEYVVSRGVDASLWERGGNEDWLVVFNPKIVMHAVAIASNDIDLAQYELKSVKHQMQSHMVYSEALNKSSDMKTPQVNLDM